MAGIERLALATGLVIVYGLFCLWCARRHHRHNGQYKPAFDTSSAAMPSTLVAYASQTGAAIELANQTVQALQGQARLLPLNQVDDRVLSNTRRALIIASTYGQGEPPDNGVRFAQRYLKRRGPDLSHLEFAVLALGDSRYPDFCHFGRGIHRSLSGHGATALGEVLELDARRTETLESVTARWHHQLQRLGGQASVFERADAAAVPGAAPALDWRLRERRLLNAGSPGQPLFHLSFEAPPGQVPRWLPGDIAEVVPEVSQTPGEPTPVVPRKYSIASIVEDGTLELVVRQQRDAQGRLGLASGWLTDGIAIGDSVAFRLCDNPLFRSPGADTPLILIGNGSGIAGLRAHLRHRQQNGGGRNWLLFGERDPDTDRIFADELNAWQKKGHLEQLDLAFSRCADQPRYVQDCLRASAARVREWVKQGAVILVCGSRVGMAQGVNETLELILGREVLESLETVGRYRRDVY